MKFCAFFAFILVVSFASAELSKEGLLDRVGKLETTINELLKKVAGSATGIVDQVELTVLKTQATVLKTLAGTINGLPIVSDLLLPGIQKTLEGVEATVDAQVKKIEALLLGATTAAPVARTTGRPILSSTTP